MQNSLEISPEAPRSLRDSDTIKKTAMILNARPRLSRLGPVQACGAGVQEENKRARGKWRSGMSAGEAKISAFGQEGPGGKPAGPSWNKGELGFPTNPKKGQKGFIQQVCCEFTEQDAAVKITKSDPACQLV